MRASAGRYRGLFLKCGSRTARVARWMVAVCVVLACAAGFQVRAAHVPSSMSAHPVIISEFSSVDVVPDGELGKFWATAKRVRFNEAAYTRKKYPKAETMVASRWTAKYLYLAFWCHYQKLNIFEGEDPAPERWGLWERDVVEAFIQPQPEHSSHYYEFEIAPTNQWIDLEIHLNQHPFNDAKWNSGFEHATRIDAAHHIWTAEMRIPVASMKVEGIKPGAEWKLNFYRNDGPGIGYARRKMSWGALPVNSAAALFHQPGSFGTIRFAGAGE
jgi:hypothetical protein